jgi:hypothetical protein
LVYLKEAISSGTLVYLSFAWFWHFIYYSPEFPGKAFENEGVEGNR